MGVIVEVLDGRGVMVFAGVVVNVIVGVKVSVTVGEAVFVKEGVGVIGGDAWHANTLRIINQDNKIRRIREKRWDLITKGILWIRQDG